MPPRWSWAAPPRRRSSRTPPRPRSRSRGAGLPLARAGGVRDGRGGLPLRRRRRADGARDPRPPLPLPQARRVRGARGRRGACFPGRSGRVKRSRPARWRGVRGVSPRPVLVAPDSFKGTFSAAEAAAAIARGLRAGGLGVDELPVADGGEGTMDVLAGAGAELRTATVTDPLGRPIQASFALLADGDRSRRGRTGQWAGPGSRGRARRVRSFHHGTGELIAAAARAGAARVLVTVGGSATTDGGAGALAASRRRAFTAAWRSSVTCAPPGSRRQRVRSTEGRRAGDRAAARARPPRARRRVAPRSPRRGHDRCRRRPLGRAVGPSARSACAGAPYVLDLVGFDTRMRQAGFVVTGEGGLTARPCRAKSWASWLRRSRQGGVTCHAVVGERDLDPFEARILDLHDHRSHHARRARSRRPEARQRLESRGSGPVRPVDLCSVSAA